MRPNPIHSPVAHLLVGQKFPDIDDTDHPKLISDIQNGDGIAKERAIMSFVPIAIGISRRFRQQHDARYDDCLSECLLSIVEAFDKVEHEGIGHDNLTGYVRSKIFKAALDHKENDPVVRIPRRSAKRHGLTPFQLREDFDVSVLEAEYPEIDIVDLMDLLHTVSECRSDSEIIQARLDGQTDKQIAKSLGVSSVTVWNRRTQLAAKLTEKLNVLYR